MFCTAQVHRALSPPRATRNLTFYLSLTATVKPYNNHRILHVHFDDIFYPPNNPLKIKALPNSQQARSYLLPSLSLGVRYFLAFFVQKASDSQPVSAKFIILRSSSSAAPPSCHRPAMEQPCAHATSKPRKTTLPSTIVMAQSPCTLYPANGVDLPFDTKCFGLIT